MPRKRERALPTCAAVEDGVRAAEHSLVVRRLNDARGAWRVKTQQPQCQGKKAHVHACVLCGLWVRAHNQQYSTLLELPLHSIPRVACMLCVLLLG